MAGLTLESALLAAIVLVLSCAAFGGVRRPTNERGPPGIGGRDGQRFIHRIRSHSFAASRRLLRATSPSSAIQPCFPPRQWCCSSPVRRLPAYSPRRPVPTTRPRHGLTTEQSNPLGHTLVERPRYLEGALLLQPHRRPVHRPAGASS